ncbi:MAG: hypothetical protein HYY30_03470 [Chloroflexi bacterium]|nr:hypothetical protein [Chloroflexota bacterium]
MRTEPTRRLSLAKAVLGVILGIYLAALAFLFGYLIWRTITIHLLDETAQMVILAAMAFAATLWGGYVASWFNHYRYSRLLGFCVGGCLYLVAALFLAIGPEDFVFILPFARGFDLAGLQVAIPPLVAGAIGGWIAERSHRRSRARSPLP